MCGIVGYIGPKKVVPVIIEGLRKLEYRGYDSAGIAVVPHSGKLEIRRAPGKLRNLEEVIAKNPLDGSYALVFLSANDPQKIVAARLGPPSVIGLGEGEYFVASDIPALLQHTREMFFLADGDIAVLTAKGVHVMDHDGRPVERPAQHVAWAPT